MSSTSQEAFEINRAISRCETYDGLVAGVLQPIVSRLGASVGAFFQIETDDGKPRVIERGAFLGPFTAAADLYRRDVFRVDPLLRYAPTVPVRLSDMLADAGKGDKSRDLHAYQRDFLRLYGIGDIVGIHIPVHCGATTKVVAVSFQRRVGMKNFTAAEKNLLDELTPTLKLVLSNLALDAEVRLLAAHIATLTDVEHPRQAVPTDVVLTKRELAIVGALRAGHSNGSMAHSMGISVRTVENHLRSIYAKATVNSRTQLLAKLFTGR
jgi:DNA-binding CsgD family transcriptional regulator